MRAASTRTAQDKRVRRGCQTGEATARAVSLHSPATHVVLGLDFCVQLLHQHTNGVHVALSCRQCERRLPFLRRTSESGKAARPGRRLYAQSHSIHPPRTLFLASTSACSSFTSTRTASTWPYNAAHASGVKPFCAGQASQARLPSTREAPARAVSLHSPATHVVLGLDFCVQLLHQHTDGVHVAIPCRQCERRPPFLRRTSESGKAATYQSPTRAALYPRHTHCIF